MRPTYFCASVRIWFAFSNRFVSSSSLLNARITLAPVRFSLVARSTWSRSACTFLYIGIVTSMIPNTISERSGIVTTNTSAAFTSTVNAMIIAPNTMNGERRNNRKTRFTPDWIWLISLVIRVINVDVPNWSISVNVNFWICSNNPCLIPVPTPVAAFAAKYCAVMEQTSPMIPSAISTKHIFTIYGLSWFAIPTSIIAAITNGTNSSKDASSILNSGASIDSFLYPFRYASNVFIIPSLSFLLF